MGGAPGKHQLEPKSHEPVPGCVSSPRRSPVLWQRTRWLIIPRTRLAYRAPYQRVQSPSPISITTGKRRRGGDPASPARATPSPGREIPGIRWRDARPRARTLSGQRGGRAETRGTAVGTGVRWPQPGTLLAQLPAPRHSGRVPAGAIHGAPEQKGASPAGPRLSSSCGRALQVLFLTE